MKLISSCIFIVTLSLATAQTSAQPINKCGVIEYAELKDMNTSELLSKISSYHSSSIFLEIERKAPASAAERAAFSNEISVCKREAQRIAAIANKRKDLSKSIYLCDKECQGYSSLNPTR